MATALLRNSPPRLPERRIRDLLLRSNSSGSFLYAANVRGGTIDVFNSSFTATTLAGSFRDPNLPAGYTPYNIQNVNGLLYVEYQNGAQAGTGGLGTGIVSVFDTNGVFQRRLISTGGQLDQPWGIVVAPASWGAFANDLLVGNFGNGEINAFNPTTGAFVGTVTDSNGRPIVNSGLWALATRTGAGFDPNAVYFTAGINGETQGLFGTITPTPEPVSLGMAAHRRTGNRADWATATADAVICFTHGRALLFEVWGNARPSSVFGTPPFSFPSQRSPIGARTSANKASHLFRRAVEWTSLASTGCG